MVVQRSSPRSFGLQKLHTSSIYCVFLGVRRRELYRVQRVRTTQLHTQRRHRQLILTSVLATASVAPVRT